MSRPTKLDRAVEEAADFNKKYPPGSRVRFWPGLKTVPALESTTRGPAWALPSGDAVVKVKGRTGGLALSNIEVIHQQAESKVHA